MRFKVSLLLMFITMAVTSAIRAEYPPGETKVKSNVVNAIEGPVMVFDNAAIVCCNPIYFTPDVAPTIKVGNIYTAVLVGPKAIATNGVYSRNHQRVPCSAKHYGLKILAFYNYRNLHIDPGLI